MPRVSSRRISAVASTLVLVSSLAIPGLASADPPEQFTDVGMGFSCPLIETADGVATATGFINENFSESAAAFWLTPPEDEFTEPDLIGFGEAEVIGMTFSAEIPLEGASGSAGMATYTATLTPIGDPDKISESGHGFRLRGTQQMASVAGTLVITGDVLPAPATFDLSSCIGFLFDQTEFFHEPDTGQDFHDEIRLDCELDNGEASGFFSALTFLEDGEALFGFSNLDLTPDDPDDFGLGGDFLMDITGANATYELFDGETGEPVGEATLNVSFTVGTTEAGRRVAQNYVQKMSATDLDVEGSLVATIGEETQSFDLDSCTAFYLTFHNIFHDPTGPKPTGKAPTNDLPAGAVALDVGDSIQQSTGGAAIPAEAPCFLQFRSTVVENTWGRTVWFSVEGTGEPITIDPAGSNFDTAVAAYTSELEHIACIDDDVTSPFLPTQAALTIDTVEGETYLIQVGGFDIGPLFEEPPNPEFGRLRLAIR